MTDRSITFSAPMVRALLDGRKTQTRRVLGTRGHCNIFEAGVWSDDYVMDPGNADWRARDIPFAIGDRLFVREEYYERGHWEPVEGVLTKGGRMKWRFVGDGVVRFDQPETFRKGRHSADPETVAWHKRLARFMPRKAARMALLIEDVRPERLQAISEDDAIAEGAAKLSWDGEETWFEDETHGTHRCGFAGLWAHLHGAGSWDANPWVVVVRFRVEQVAP